MEERALLRENPNAEIPNSVLGHNQILQASTVSTFSISQFSDVQRASEIPAGTSVYIGDGTSFERREDGSYELSLDNGKYKEKIDPKMANIAL